MARRRGTYRLPPSDDEEEQFLSGRSHASSQLSSPTGLGELQASTVGSLPRNSSLVYLAPLPLQQTLQTFPSNVYTDNHPDSKQNNPCKPTFRGIKPPLTPSRDRTGPRSTFPTYMMDTGGWRRLRTLERAETQRGTLQGTYMEIPAPTNLAQKEKRRKSHLNPLAVEEEAAVTIPKDSDSDHDDSEEEEPSPRRRSRGMKIKEPDPFTDRKYIRQFMQQIILNFHCQPQTFQDRPGAVKSCLFSRIWRQGNQGSGPKSSSSQELVSVASLESSWHGANGPIFSNKLSPHHSSHPNEGSKSISWTRRIHTEVVGNRPNNSSETPWDFLHDAPAISVRWQRTGSNSYKVTSWEGRPLVTSTRCTWAIPLHEVGGPFTESDHSVRYFGTTTPGP